MGGELQFYEHRNNPTHEELHVRFDAERSVAGCDYGTGGYSGTLYEKDGLTIHDNVVASYEVAEDILGSNDKWGSAEAVPFHAEDVEVPKAVKKRAIERLVKAEKSYSDANDKAFSDIVNTKSKTISCKSCGSRHIRKHLIEAKCPTCNTSLISETNKKRIASKYQKITEARAKLNDVQHEVTIKKGIHYLVGGICSC